MKNKRQKTIVIFDGDTLAYRASSAIDGRSIVAINKATLEEHQAKNQTEFSKSMLETNPDFKLDDYDLIQVQDALNPQRAFDIIDNKIQNTLSALFADEYIVAISGKNNFRDTLPLPSKYKSNRNGTLRPKHLIACKKMLWKQHPNIVSDNAEADDYLVFKGYEYARLGYNVILGTQDKDSNAYSGLQLYDFTKDFAVLETIPDGLGWLKDTGKKIDGRAMLWYAYQVLNGDSTDCINPRELHKQRFGSKSVYKYLKDSQSVEEALTRVANKYKEWFNDYFEYTCWQGIDHKVTWIDVLQMYHKAVRMMEHEQDDLEVVEFYKKHGVDLYAMYFE